MWPRASSSGRSNSAITGRAEAPELNAFGAVWLVAVLARVVTSAWLSGRQIRAAEEHAKAASRDADENPNPRNGEATEEFAEKSCDASTDADAERSANERAQTGAYVSARMRQARAAEIAQAAVALLLTLGGGIALIDSLWRLLAPTPVWLGAASLVTVFALLRVTTLPFLAWRVFVIEARFGFNRMSMGLFFADLGKRMLLGAALAVPAAAGAVWLVAVAGSWWWLMLFAAWLALSVAWIWARPVVVAPLFNRFMPLADPALVRRVEDLLERCGFAPDGIFVMDGSRRSAHLNASLSGLGRHKRIVFLDTLLERLDAEEIEAVLAHELGHFRLSHVRQRLVVAAIAGLAGFVLLGWLGRHDGVYAMLGFANPNPHALLALALVAAPVGAFFVLPLRSRWARRQELEADAFAREHAGAGALVRALDEIHRDNRADFAPDPIFTAFYATHPPLAARLARLVRESRSLA
jgi:STE24 endopeptidase